MAFCRRCGRELMEGERFCRDCGTPVGQADPSAAPRRKGRLPVLLLTLVVIFGILTLFSMVPVFQSGDYRITIEVEEIALCNTDMTVDNDPADNIADIVLLFTHDGKKNNLWEGDPLEVPVGDPGGDWKSDPFKPTEKNVVSFEAYGSGTAYISLFMADYDGYSNSLGGGTDIYDTIDIFDSNAPEGVERPGVSGVLIPITLKPGTSYTELEGDDLPKGYLKLKVTVEKI